MHQHLTPSQNQKLFSSIANQYDFLNHLLSLNFFRSWKNKLVERAEIKPGDRVLDLCTGTGEIAIEFAKKDCAGEIVGIDITEEMLEVAERKIKKKTLEDKIKLQKGNVLELSFEDNSFDVVSMAFGLRNIGDYQKAISEITRVLKNGGRMIILEFSPPQKTFFGFWHNLYLKTIVPTVGGIISGSKTAYRYLEESISGFPKPEEVVQIMQEEGLKDIYCKRLTGGIAYLYQAQKEMLIQIKGQVSDRNQKEISNQNIIQGDLFGSL